MAVHGVQPFTIWKRIGRMHAFATLFAKKKKCTEGLYTSFKFIFTDISSSY